MKFALSKVKFYLCTFDSNNCDCFKLHLQEQIRQQCNHNSMEHNFIQTIFHDRIIIAIIKSDNEGVCT